MLKAKSKSATPPIKSTVNFHRYAGLDYVSLIQVPILRVGNSVSTDENRTFSSVDQALAKVILRKKIPIHGRELKFFRLNVLKLPLDKFANELSVNTSTIFKWERAKDQRLHPINEVAVRVLMATKLNLNLRIEVLDHKIDASESTSIIRLSAKKLIKFNEMKS